MIEQRIKWGLVKWGCPHFTCETPFLSHEIYQLKIMIPKSISVS